MLICDFCAQHTAVKDAKTHYTAPFVLEFGDLPVSGQSTTVSFSEDWLACPECDELIKSGQASALLARAKSGRYGSHPSVEQVQAKFWEHRRLDYSLPKYRKLE